MFCGLRKDRKLLLLTIQLDNSTIFHIKAKPSMKIEEIKAQCGVESERSSLYFEKTLLKDDAQIREYELNGATELTLLLHDDNE